MIPNMKVFHTCKYIIHPKSDWYYYKKILLDLHLATQIPIKHRYKKKYVPNTYTLGT